MFPPVYHPKLTWYEPSFFKLSSRTTADWIWWFGGAMVIYVALATYLLTADVTNFDRPATNFAAKLVIPGLVTFAVLVLFELPNWRRVVSLTDHEVTCTSVMVTEGGLLYALWGIKQWSRSAIARVELLRPGEAGNRFPFGLIVVFPTYSRPGRIGVPKAIALEDVATQLHSMNVAVSLSGWTPPTPSSALPSAET